MIQSLRLARRAAVAVLLLASFSATAQETSDPAALAAGFNEALAAGDWAAAISAGEKLVEAEAGNAILRYNLACAYALSDRSDAAMASLQESADLGFDLLSTLDSDGDLDSIRSHPGFTAVRARVERNAAAARQEFERLSESAQVRTVLPRGVVPAIERSVIAVNPYTTLAFGDNKVWVQTSDDQIVALSLEDLRIAP